MHKWIIHLALLFVALVTGDAIAQPARFVGAWQLDGGAPARQRVLVITQDGERLRVRIGVVGPEPRLGLADAALGADGTLTVTSNAGTVVVLTMSDENTMVGRFNPPAGKASAARGVRMSAEATAALSSPRAASPSPTAAALPAGDALLAKADLEAIASGKKWTMRRLADGQSVVWDLREGGNLFGRNLSVNSGDAGTWAVNEKGQLCVKWRGNSTDVCVVVAKDGPAYKTYNVAAPASPLHELRVE